MVVVVGSRLHFGEVVVHQASWEDSSRSSAVLEPWGTLMKEGHIEAAIRARKLSAPLRRKTPHAQG